MKYASNGTIILITALTITLISTVLLNGIQEARAENAEKEDSNKVQTNSESQQINKCQNDTQNEGSNVECNNVIVYGVVCMPGSVCKIENYDVPFELVTPF